MKKTIFILLFAISFGSCKFGVFQDPNHAIIKKDLDSRFTKFEIVEIRKDTANVDYALNAIRALQIRISEANLQIVKALVDAGSGKKALRTPYQNLIYIDSIDKALHEFFQKFESSRFDKVDPCYYVKYLVHKAEQKIPKEEYYFLNKYNGDVLHRNYNWDEFLYDKEYDKILNDALQYTGEIMDLRYKVTGKY